MATMTDRKGGLKTFPESRDSRNDGTDPNDDSGFLKELEIAKALSLETLELDKIRRQRFTYEAQVVSLKEIPSSPTTTITTTTSLTSTDSGGVKSKDVSSHKSQPSSVKVHKKASPPKANETQTADARISRPRPGTTRQASLTTLPPPPRRVSHSGTSAASPFSSSLSASQAASCSSPDLMSFAGPDGESSKGKFEFDPLLGEPTTILLDKVAEADKSTVTSNSQSVLSLVYTNTNGNVNLSKASASPFSQPLARLATAGSPSAPFSGPSLHTTSISLQGPLPLSQWNFPPPVVVVSSRPPVPPFPASQSNFPRPVLMQSGNSVGGRLALPSTVPVVPLALSGGIQDSKIAVLRGIEKKANGNLIDLSFFESSADAGDGPQDGIVRASTSRHGRVSWGNEEDLLKSFDPLMTMEAEAKQQTSPYVKLWETKSKENEIEDGSHQERNEDSKEDLQTPTTSAPPVPVRTHSRESAKSEEAEEEKVVLRCNRRPGAHRSLSYRQRCSRVYESIKLLSERKGCNPEVDSFRDALVRLRRQYTYDDYLTNVGFVISPTLESLREESTSVKLVIHSVYTERPESFACDVTTSIEHVISQIVFSVFEDVNNVNVENFVLKVHGMSEYFAADSALVDYEYVHYCQKFDDVVQLTLLDTDTLQRPLARTIQDDETDTDIPISRLLSSSGSSGGQPMVCHRTLTILTETLEREIERLKKDANQGRASSLQAKGVIQAVKAICAILAQVETKSVREAVEDLMQVVLFFSRTPLDKDVPHELESELLSDVLSRPFAEAISSLPNTATIRLELLSVSLERINEAIRNLLYTYCRCFFVDFSVPVLHSPQDSIKDITAYRDTFLVNLYSVHRFPPQWTTSFECYLISCELYHGTRLLSDPVETRHCFVSTSFYDQIVFDQWMEIPSVCLCILPREARLCCTLYGVRTVTADGVQQEVREPLGWAALQLFDYNGKLEQGSSLCGMWSEEVDKRLGPAISNTQDSHCPVIQLTLPDFGCTVIFPPVLQDLPRCRTQKREFESLSSDIQQKLLEIVERSSSSNNILEDREVLWGKRHYLYDLPQALPKVLLAAHSWDWSCLADLYLMIKEWRPMNAVDALELLLPCFPDLEVRKMAILWIKNMGSDELCDYLPQMVQESTVTRALKYETYEESPTANFLLERSLTSIRVMHHLYWLLKQNIEDVRCGRRVLLLLNSLKAIAGQAMRNKLERQEELMKNLAKVAVKIKETKESLRMGILSHELEILNTILEESPSNLPLGPSLEVCGLDLKSCHFYVSNTIPLKLSFRSVEVGARPIEAIFKEGDDLRQDMLTLQMIRIMDKLWLKEGLDLRILTFGCVPTGYKKGIVEMVKGAETLRKIHVEHGLAGSFKDHPIADWLQKQNPSELEYQLAVENFTYSCAGYSVATYILGVCDRHNDNIMIKSSGHIFHIDFSKFLGDSQTFAGIKRDRVPFVLTSDMAYVINGGDKPSSKFQNFVDICCLAFNIIRKHGNLFLNLFALMVTAGIPGVTSEAVNHIQNSLLMNSSDDEASMYFTRMIEESLKSWFTQFNFFIHNLAQFRLSGEEQNSDSVLSFVPRTYTLESDPKITAMDVVGYQKRYDPEKHYVFILKVDRQGQAASSYLFRSYREFCEFHQKLCMRFPLAKYRSLPRVYLGRSNVRQVTEKRKAEIHNFLVSLWSMADEIKHCELVYTFFHTLLRDQQEEYNHRPKSKDLTEAASQEGFITGQVKLSVHYKTDSLFVMIMHARNLSEVKGQAPDPYVKTYLIPDQNKTTKRKTKVVRRNCHPTFMEMLVYRMPLEAIRQKMLQVSVWNYGLVAENAFLGAVAIDLSKLNLEKQSTDWYQLGNLLCR